MNIELTQPAITKIKEIAAQDPLLAGKALRIFVESGGCSSYQYGFKFDAAGENDIQKDLGEVKVVIDPESHRLLNGSVIDYKEEFGGEGFAVQNPNVKKSCGCGKSFDA